jgi:hypothetical protein
MTNPIVPQERNLMPYYSNSIPEGLWIDPSTGDTFMSTKAMSRLLEIDKTTIESSTEFDDIVAYGVELDNETTMRYVRLHSIDTFLEIMMEYRLDLFREGAYRGLLNAVYIMVGFAGIPERLSNSPSTKTLEDTIYFLRDNDSVYNYVYKLVAPFLHQQFQRKSR